MVPALKLGNPVCLLVLVKPYDPLLHLAWSRFSLPPLPCPNVDSGALPARPSHNGFL